jgi:hypothetical protein
MLQSGNDRVAPFHSMWPLFCNEVVLSYDQEERVRNYQRTLLQTPETWLDRHTGKASGLAMQSLHDCFNSAAVSMRQRERSMLNGLSPQQRLKFLVWADKNKDRIQAKVEQKKRENPKPPKEEKFALSPNHHIAANLYILNHRLQQVLASLPRPITLVGPADLKRLARRPSFESLGHQKEDLDRALTREASYASEGSLLKRSSSSQSMDDEDKPQPQQVSPEDGQETAIPLIEQVLGFVKELIPPSPPLSLPQAQPTFTPSIQIPSPAPVENPVTYHHYTAPPPVLSHAPLTSAPHSGHLQTVHYAPHPGASIAYTAPVQHQVPLIHYQHHPHSAPPPQMMHQPPPHLQYYQPCPPPPQHQQVQHHHVVVVQPQPVHVASHPPPPQAESQRAPQATSPTMRTHVRGSSFLPPHLNVVPEEMFPSGESAEEIFMSLMNDEDWAIGEGIDMDSAA